MRIKIVNESRYEQLVKGSEHAVGYDIRVYLEDVHHLTIWPGDTVAVPTGLYIELPVDIEMQIRSRSGLALKGLVVANAPGTIDPDYRGEVKILIHNQSNTEQYIKDGDRIAQAVFSYIARPEFETVFIVDELSHTYRGDNGFGSTGTE